MKKIKIKRIYDEPSSNDGYRILVDRLWPRGISKEKAAIDEWNKDLAPSTELRKWFHHAAVLFDLFEEKYRNELSEQTTAIKHVMEINKHRDISLLYGTKDPNINHAIVLLDVIQNKINDYEQSNKKK